MRNNFKIHFIGVLGAGMNVLAKYLYDLGFIVSGSDAKKTALYDELKSYGINVYIGSDIQKISESDVIVYSSAIKESDDELNVAIKLNKAIYSRSQVLGLILKAFKQSIGVSGSHGKTTVTSMLAHVLNSTSNDFTAFIGGQDSLFNSYHNTKSKDVVVSEVCEYNNNIKDITTTIALTLNIDDDHLDSFKDFNGLKDAFYSFSDRANYRVVCYDNKYLKEYNNSNVLTFGFSENANYYAVHIKSVNGKYQFSCKLKNNKKLKIKLNVVGKHNILNALSVIAVCDGVLNIDSKYIKQGLENFSGVKRRFEVMGSFCGYSVLGDYCHHPTEIKATITSLKEIYKNDYLIVFQPHTFSRTKLLMCDFVNVLKTEKVMVYKTYSARENYSSLGSSRLLAQKLNCEHFENIKTLKIALKKRKYANNLIILGAGNLYDLIQEEIKKATL